ncbi:MAG TPA: homoserine kinase [Steroidobacteraceae bacterium]|nr:homoserine kinase [Steroidobacteraceae bacterium]
MTATSTPPATAGEVDRRPGEGRTSATAFAPASVGNVGVGFDILGHTVAALGDRVRATRRDEPGVVIRSITGVHVDLPREAAKNTAGMAVLAMVKDLELPYGFELEIEKGIPLGSGLGGSAASAVAGIVAAAALVDERLDRAQLLKYAMQGEAVASGSVHVDNIAPSLYGGLVLTVGIDNPFVKQIPVPEPVRCVLVHPHMVLATREARAILSQTVPLSDVIWQQANLAGFLAGCFSGDLALIRESLLDVVIEPQRQVLIPGFVEVKQAALAAGALGASISGAGPTVFAWCDEADAEKVRAGMVEAFARHGLETDSWISTIDRAGARVVGD